MVGILIAKDLLAQCTENGPRTFNLRDLLRSAFFVPERKPLNGYFGTAFRDEEFDTIGGLVTNALCHVPKKGETV